MISVNLFSMPQVLQHAQLKILKYTAMHAYTRARCRGNITKCIMVSEFIIMPLNLIQTRTHVLYIHTWCFYMHAKMTLLQNALTHTRTHTHTHSHTHIVMAHCITAVLRLLLNSMQTRTHVLCFHMHTTMTFLHANTHCELIQLYSDHLYIHGNSAP